MVPLRETCKLFIGKISGQIDSRMSEFKVPQLELDASDSNGNIKSKHICLYSEFILP